MTLNLMMDFDAARANASTNAFRLFPNKGDGKSGSERMRDPDHARISHTPKFKLNKTDKFFTIGSCFARNVEFALKKLNVPILTMDEKIPDELYEQTGVGARTGALNAYTPYAIRDLIATSQRSDRNSIAKVKVGDDTFIDMLVSGIKPTSGKDFDYVRNAIMSAYDKIPQADVVVITLGYTECWYYLPDSVFVNRSPGGQRKLLPHASNFSFGNCTPAEVVSSLNDTVALLRAATDNKVKIILTVSPVPMNGTWTSKDVICANLYSKSTLLSAAVSVAAAHDFIDYYPSYEMVTMSPTDTTWEADGVHVLGSRVSNVIGTFTDLYFT